MAAQPLTLPNRLMWGPPDKMGFPSPQEFLSAKKELKALEIELQDAIKELEKAQLRVDNLMKRLEEGRAWIAPIRGLPVELLSEIFVLNSKDEPLGPVKIASVCRGWRSIVLATPHAWCRIWLYNNLSHDNCYQYVSTFLERSDPVLLHLNIPLQYDLKDEEDFSICSILFGKPHRIQCLSIISDHLADVYRRTFPNLTDLSLMHRDGTILLPSTFNSTFPRLETLETASMPWGKLPRPMFGSIPPLKRLSISADPADAWLDIIQYCSATLESLAVCCRSRRYGALPEITLDFPVLKFLEFIGYEFNWPTHVRTPALVSYSITSSAGRLHGDVTTVTHLQTQRVPILLKYSSLRTLGLKSSLAAACVLFEQLEENANICPHLEVVDLVLTGISPGGDGYHLAQAKIEEAKQKTKRDIRLIIGERWGVLMAFDIELSRCEDEMPCEFDYVQKELSTKQ